jgi:hypothetical protein
LVDTNFETQERISNLDKTPQTYSASTGALLHFVRYSTLIIACVSIDFL